MDKVLLWQCHLSSHISVLAVKLRKKEPIQAVRLGCVIADLWGSAARVSNGLNVSPRTIFSKWPLDVLPLLPVLKRFSVQPSVPACKADPLAPLLVLVTNVTFLPSAYTECLGFWGFFCYLNSSHLKALLTTGPVENFQSFQSFQHFNANMMYFPLCCLADPARQKRHFGVSGWNIVA